MLIIITVIGLMYIELFLKMYKKKDFKKERRDNCDQKNKNWSDISKGFR